MSPLRRLRTRERVALAIVLGVAAGVVLALAAWITLSNEARIAEVQASRVSAAELACSGQNHRHEVLFAGIEAIAAVQAKTEPVKYRRTYTKEIELEDLLDAIQPQEDCKARAQQLEQETLGRHVKLPAPIRKPGPLRLPPPSR